MNALLTAAGLPALVVFGLAVGVSVLALVAVAVDEFGSLDSGAMRRSHCIRHDVVSEWITSVARPLDSTTQRLAQRPQLHLTAADGPGAPADDQGPGAPPRVLTERPLSVLAARPPLPDSGWCCRDLPAPPLSVRTSR